MLRRFEFTYSSFPGQTVYHGGLPARHESGTGIFFVGDSFTPSGMDDYCLLNRNFLAPEKGFLNCLRQIQELGGDYLLVNQHVPPTFRFSPQQLDTMISNFTRRRELFADLFPWNDPNFGVDEQWARFYPYSAEVPAGGRLMLEVILRNHSAEAQEFRVTSRASAGWQVPTGPLRISVPPRSERPIQVPVSGARRSGDHHCGYCIRRVGSARVGRSNSFGEMNRHFPLVAGTLSTARISRAEQDKGTRCERVPDDRGRQRPTRVANFAGWLGA